MTVVHVPDVDVGQPLGDFGSAVRRHLVDDDDFVDELAGVREALLESSLLIEHDDVERDTRQARDINAVRCDESKV